MSDAAATDPPARTRFEPPMSPAAEPFWAATRERRLVLPWCRACDVAHWYPRDTCPHCLTDDIEWREATGRGVVYAASVMPKPAMPMLADRVPYAVVLVDLDEGVRVLSNLVDLDVDVVAEGGAIGLAVRANWEALSDGRHLLLFAPAADGAPSGAATG